MFKLAGEEFVCKGEGDISSLDVLGYVAGMTGDNGLKRIKAIVDIFAAFIPGDDGHVPGEQPAPSGEPDVFKPSSRQRFESLIRRRKVRLTLLFEIASYVLDEYLRFPTREAASQSSNGSSTEARSSAAGSSELASVSSN